MSAETNPVKFETVSKTYLLCAKCNGHVGTVDHLVKYPEFNGSWYCDDCGIRNRFTVKDGVVVESHIDAVPSYCFKKLVLAEAAGTHPPMRFLAESVLHTDNAEGKVTLEDIENARYWLEEHTCPTNWLNVNLVAVGDDLDPHGAFKLLSVWGPGDTDAIEMRGFESDVVSDEEVLLGGEDIFGGGDEQDLLVRAWLVMEKTTLALHLAFSDTNTPWEQALDAFREWVNLYGTNPRAWWLLDGLCNGEDAHCELTLTYGDGVWNGGLFGTTVTYNERTGELKVG